MNIPYMPEEYPNFTIIYDLNEMHLKGVSYMEEPEEFYKPVLEEIRDFLNTNPKFIKFFIDLEYFNTSSSKYMLEIFNMMVPYRVENREVVVYWLYDEDDDNMHEAGIDYNALVDLPFELVSVSR